MNSCLIDNRRKKRVANSGKVDAFKKECAELLVDEIETFIYYGISKGCAHRRAQRQVCLIYHNDHKNFG